MKGHMPNQLVSAALLVTLTPWCVGCATEIHLRQAAGVVEGGGGGRLLVRVFENRSDRSRDISTHRRVVTELYRVEGKAEKLVREEKEPSWSVSDLPPGEYTLRVSKWIDKWGAVQMLPSKQDEAFVIRANETTMADVVFSDPKKAWVRVGIGIVVVVGVGLVLAHQAMQNWHPLAGLSFH